MTNHANLIPGRSTYEVCRFPAKPEISVSATPTLWDKKNSFRYPRATRISVLVVLRRPLRRRIPQKTPPIFFENVCWLAAVHAEHGFRLHPRSSRLSCVDGSRVCPPGSRRHKTRCPALSTRRRSGGFILNVAGREISRISAPRRSPRSFNCCSHCYDIHATTMLQSPTTSR